MEMALSEIRSDIEAIRDNISLYEETNFISRAEASDYIYFHIIDRIDLLLQEINPPGELLVLKQQAHGLKYHFEKINTDLFLCLREGIQSGVFIGKALRNEIDKYLINDTSTETVYEEIGYDNLDLLINGIFPVLDIPVETKEREPEMVFYQKTPARIIFELAEKGHFMETDVFYDLGSGLGQVSILVNLLTGIKSKGVEFEPEFCNYARVCASELNSKNVEFINADARLMSYSDGTIFFMYTPFVGKILQEVLNIIEADSKKRTIRLFTYGPCTIQVAQQSWLIPIDQNVNDVYKLSEFRSFKL